MDRVAFMEGNAKALLRALRAADLPVVDLAMHGDHASCVVPLLNLPDWELRRPALTAASVVPAMGLSLVSVVGDGLGTPKAIEQLMSVVKSPRALVAGPLRISAVVPAEDVAGLQKALHTAFVAQEPAAR
jgi:hypothetical protein